MCTYIFDKVTLRERFICSGASLAQLPIASNIYLAYENFFDLHEPRLQTNAFAKTRLPTIGIFPGSRLSRKVIPNSIVNFLINQCQKCGVRPILFLLEGKSCSLEQISNIETIIVPRRFSSMADAVQMVSAVISADSMPAHMAEYYGQPVYVVTPTPNDYWLPLSSFKLGRWACFERTYTSESSLSDFIAQNYHK